MANNSSVYGTIALKGVWTPEMIRNLNIVMAEWAAWTYYIAADGDFSANCLTQKFNACGRWAFNLNLAYLHAWTKRECKTKPLLEIEYQQLIAEMHRNCCYIAFAYSEEETGNQILRDGTAQIEADNSSLIVASLSEQNCDYCWNEFLKRDFCGESMLEELIDEIIELLRVDDDLGEDTESAIEQWVKANTIPNDYAEELEAEQLSELKLIITGKKS